MADNGERLVTAQEAARLLGLTPQTIRVMGKAGRLPVLHPTGTRSIRFRFSDVMALVVPAVPR